MDSRPVHGKFDSFSFFRFCRPKKIFFLYIIFIASLAFCQNSPDSLTVHYKPSGQDLWFAKDKADHFLSSAFLSGFGYYVATQELNTNNQQAEQIALSFSLSTGVLKEFYDLQRGGKFSWKDIVADIAGASLGLYLITIGR